MMTRTQVFQRKEQHESCLAHVKIQKCAIIIEWFICFSRLFDNTLYNASLPVPDSGISASSSDGDGSEIDYYKSMEKSFVI